MSAQRAQRVLRVFYRDYLNQVGIPSTHPESLLASRLVPLAEQLLVPGDNFLGVVDPNDVILQCYVGDDPATITLELVFPEADGCLRLILPRQRALDRLGRLPDAFEESWLNGAEYVD